MKIGKIKTTKSTTTYASNNLIVQQVNFFLTEE